MLPGQVVRLQDVQAPRIATWRGVSLSAVRTDRLPVKGWFDPKITVWPKGLSQWKIPMIPSGIEPVNFGPVAQCFNHLRQHVLHLNNIRWVSPEGIFPDQVESRPIAVYILHTGKWQQWRTVAIHFDIQYHSTVICGYQFCVCSILRF